MIFSCFPPDGKCEWNHLSGFVARYNDMFGTTYRRSACLDVETRDEKEPELLLEAPGESPIVIERKSVVWPHEYFSDHRNEHDLRRFFVDKVRSAGNPFSHSAYQLIVDAESLKGKTKKQFRNLRKRSPPLFCQTNAPRNRQAASPAGRQFRGVSALFYPRKEIEQFPKLASVLSPGRTTNHLRFFKESKRRSLDMPKSSIAWRRLLPKSLRSTPTARDCS